MSATAIAPQKPQKRRFKYSITDHAVERMKEYGSDLANNADPYDVRCMLEDYLIAAMHKYKDCDTVYFDQDNVYCWLYPFTDETWAEPGLYLLVYFVESMNQHQIRSVVTQRFVDKDGKFTKNLAREVASFFYTDKKGLGATAPTVLSALHLPGEPVEETPAPLAPVVSLTFATETPDDATTPAAPKPEVNLFILCLKKKPAKAGDKATPEILFEGPQEELQGAVLRAIMAGNDPSTLSVYQHHGSVNLNIQIGNNQ